jgi:hypothetical protein
MKEHVFTILKRNIVAEKMSRYLVPLLMVLGLVRTQDSSTNSTGELSLPNPKVCSLYILQMYRGQIQRKTWCLGPYAGVDYITSPYVQCTLQRRLPHF